MLRSRPKELVALSNRHATLLSDSQISEAVAATRGYRTVTVKAELERLGFGRLQQRVPTLLIPIWGVHGDEPATYQHRPDEPRAKGGKPLKYETPSKSRMALDVPREARSELADPRIPLFVTEGARKADAAVSSGLCCIALLGVWNWRGTNAHGGKTALSDWESIALNGREVFVAFDSDVMTKPAVFEALGRLSAFLKSRKAKVKIVYLRPAEDQSKVGLDDFFAAGGTVDDLYALAESTLRKPPLGTRDSQYSVDDAGNTLFHKQVGDEIVRQRLANFSAIIVNETLEDDGVESTRFLCIEALVGGERRTVRVRASQFPALGWVTDLLGPNAILSAGFGCRERLREAIQLLSPSPIPSTRVYTHLGWVHAHGEWIYLHSGGGIGRNGVVNGIETLLPEQLAAHCLPAPPVGEKLRDAVRFSLELLDGVAPDRIMFPLVSLAMRTVLGNVSQSGYISGSTGLGKSTLAAVICSFFGEFSSPEDLKVSWASTPNWIETMAFAAKDNLLVVDDFNPVGTSADVARMNKDADRLLRAQGNSAGRGRLNSEGRAKTARPPRGALLCTGEDIPAGHSLRARLMIAEIEKGDLDLARLATIGADRGTLTLAMSGFVRALAGSLDLARNRRDTFVAEVRDMYFSRAQHPRTATNAADLLFGFVVFTEFAESIGAIDDDELSSLRERAVNALLEVVHRQSTFLSSTNPVEVFLRQLDALLRSGRAHLVDHSTGLRPDDETTARLTGWRAKETKQAREWHPGGQKIGWVDSENDSIYLIPEAAFHAIQSLAAGSADRIPLSLRTLRKNLREAGALVSWDDKRTTKKVRVEGSPTNALHFSFAGVFGESGTTGTPGTLSRGKPQDAEQGRLDVSEPARSPSVTGTNRENSECLLADPHAAVLDIPNVPASHETLPSRDAFVEHVAEMFDGDVLGCDAALECGLPSAERAGKTGEDS